MPDAAGADQQQSVPDVQRLCLSCGLCCRGVWFSHALLQEGEVDFAHRVGLQVQTLEGKVSIRIPCVQYGENGCGVYEVWRPKLCKEYTCALLDRCLASEVTLEEALSHVISARTMADRVQSEAGPSAGWLFGKAFLSRVMESAADDSSAFPALSPAAKADTVALLIYFKKYFEK